MHRLTWPLVRSALLLILLSLNGWAVGDDFCGPGPHPQCTSCPCFQAEVEAISCLCQDAPEQAFLFSNSRDRLPALLDFLPYWLDPLAPGLGTIQEWPGLSAPPSWEEAPIRPHRAPETAVQVLSLQS